MVLWSFLASLAVVVVATMFVVVRGLALFRQAKRTGRAFSAEMAAFEERSARTERVLADAQRASADLDVALARLRVSRAQLGVLTQSIDRAAKRVRWLRAFLPV